MPLLLAILFGLAAACLAWAFRGWFAARYRQDLAWVEETSLRFSPERSNPQVWTLLMYTVLGGVLLFLLTATPSPVFGALLWLAMLPLPKLVVEILWRARRKRIDQQLPGTIAAMSNSIRAGLTLVQALQRLAETAPDPIRSEFRIMANQYAYGSDLDTVIRAAKGRLNLPNFNLFASALLLNREMGGDVSDTLTRISMSLDRLRQMKMTVEAHTSEGRTNIKVLLIAPVLMLLLMSTMDPEGVGLLLTTSQGYVVLLIAGTLTGTGVYFAARITRSEV